MKDTQVELGFTAKEWIEGPFVSYRPYHPDGRRRWAEELACTWCCGERFCADYRFLAREGQRATCCVCSNCREAACVVESLVRRLLWG